MNKSSATVLLSKMPIFVAIILVLQIALYISFFFHIAIAQQVVGFLYFIFLPGFVIAKLMKLENLGLAETALFSVGLSVAFVMIAGLVLNEVGLLVGIKQPLEPSLLVLVLSGFVLLATLACYFRGSQNLQPIGLTKGTVLKLFALCLLPVLSIVGAYFANITGNTSILLLALFAVLIVFVLAVFSERLLTPKLHLIILLMIAITLLFQFSLISNYAQGFDIKVEYHVATVTQNSGFWNSSASFADKDSGRYYSMLSITLLPTIYSNILNMDITWVFKLIYPLIFVLVPLALYLLWRGRFGSKVAFFSAFLFMGQASFYTDMLSLTRQMIAEVFFVLAFFVLFSKGLSNRNAKILFIIFGFLLIVSHYGISLIFGAFISLLWLLRYFTKKLDRHLSLKMVVAYLVLMFTWYVYSISSAVMISVKTTQSSIVYGFSDFFNPAFRSTTVTEGIGLATLSSPLYTVSRIVAYATEFFIIIGFLILILQRKKKDFDFEYFILCLASIIILLMCIVLPNFAGSLNMTRFYHVLLFFLSPLFALGAIELFRVGAKLLGFVAKRKTEIYSLILITVVLGSYFLFQTNLIYEVSGEKSWSLPLSRYKLGDRLYTDFWFVTGPQIGGANWLIQNTHNANPVYADTGATQNLIAYGIDPTKINILDVNPLPPPGGFIYLNELYTVYNELKSYGYNGYVYTNASDVLASQQLSVIYNNRYIEIAK